MMKFTVSFLLVSCTLVFSATYNKVADLPFNADGRLTKNILIHKDSAKCLKEAKALVGNSKHRELGSISPSLSEAFFGKSNSGNGQCSLLCLEMGLSSSMITYNFPEKMYHFGQSSEFKNARDWYHVNCNAKEAGFISTVPELVHLYWINENNERSLLSEIKTGEKHTVWQNTFLGHTFEAVNSETDEILGRYVIQYDAFYRIGEIVTGIDPNFQPMGYTNFSDAVLDLFHNEWDRSREVKRTFTEVGFAKGKLPLDLYNSISAFYYNNRNHYTREEWKHKGLFVNWWETDSYLITMPWNLKRYWQSRLKTLVETWSNTTLELTDIYGLRRYNEGARLLTHVDRTSTHAASLIINVAQGNVETPWKVEIYDHADRLHEIDMSPGDIVYYESARCLHGRMAPLTGKNSFYVNLFAHYRPVDDPSWYLKETPANHIHPILDLNTVDVSTKMPYLSTSHEQLYGGQDLLRWWQHVSPPTPFSAGATGVHSREEL